MKYLSMRYLLTLSLLCSFFTAANTHAATTNEIYFVRHAETLGNVTHQHNRKNDRTLSSLGLQQVKQLTAKLGGLQSNAPFDAIIVSPKYRALITILPFLKKYQLQAEIWPELQECCWQEKTSRLSSATLQRGKMIKLEPDMRRYFTFPNAEAHRKYASKNYGDGLLQTFKAAQLVRKRFAHSGKRILIIGHYHSGARLIEILQGIEPDGRYKLSNAKITHLKENSDGSFQLIDLNQ